MKKITKLAFKSGNKYELVIENEKHIIYDDVLLDYKLLGQKEISDQLYQDILDKNAFYDAYYKALKYITYKLRTEREVRIKLTKLMVSKENQNLVIQKLKSDGYLNDELYVKSFINDQVNLSLNGPLKIKKELTNNHFKEELINKYLDKIANDVWQERINKIILKKQKANHNLNAYRFILKLKQDLFTMGYPESLFKDLTDNIFVDDEKILKNDYQKLYNKLSKKYTDEKLWYMLKQKLYALGYNSDDIDALKKD